MSVTWLLVSGASRSGTTFLNTLLNAHPRVATFTETGIDEIIGQIRRCLGIGKVISGSRGAYLPDMASADDVDRVAKTVYEVRFGKDDVAIVGDKMPNVNRQILAAYRQHLPRLKQIYIVRKPSSTISSSLERREFTRLGADTWHITSVEDAIVEWALNWEHVAQSQGALAVSYERFEDDTASELGRIADFLEIDAGLFPERFFKREPGGRYELPASDAAAIDRILGPVEALLPGRLEHALTCMPRIYPTVAVDRDIEINKATAYASLYLKTGFSLLEDWGVWTDQHAAMLGFRLDETVDKVRVSLDLTAFMGTRSHFDLHIKASGQRDFEVRRIDNSTNRLSVEVECRPRYDGVVELVLEMPVLKNSSEEPTYDPRALGIGLFGFKTRRVP